MLFELWEVNLSEQELAAEEGAYENIRLRTKESIILERSGQVLLKSISTSTHQSIPFSPIQYSFSKAHYEFETILGTPKLAKRKLPRWPGALAKPLPSRCQGVAKEKINLDAQGIQTLKWLQGLKLLELSFPEIERRQGNYQEGKLLDIESASSEKNASSQLTHMPAMPSILQDRFLALTSEALGEFIIPQFAKGEDNELRSMIKPLFEDCLIDSVKVKPTNFPTEISNVKDRTSPTQRTCEEVFQDMHQRLFDQDFHAFDFYEVKVPKMRASPLSQSFKQTAHKVWEISKESTRDLDWYPFKRLAEKASATLQEDVTPVSEYRPHHVSLTFPIMNSNLIESIETKSGAFSSLKIHSRDCNTASAAEPSSAQKNAVDNQSSSISEEGDTQESMKQSTSLYFHGKSHVDEGFEAMVHAKRRKLASGKETCKTSKQLASVSISGVQIGCGLSTPVTKATPMITPFEEIDLGSREKTVLVNLSRLKYNHRTIRYLKHANKVNLIEQEIPIPCDFILDPLTCIVRVQLSNFFRMKTRNTLYYEKTLAQLLTEFRKVIILVEYLAITEAADQEAIWKIHLYLNRPEFEVHFILSDSKVIGRWVCKLAEKHTSDPPYREIGHSNDDEELLLALNLNKFQIGALLRRYDLPTILLLSLADDSTQLEEVMMPSQVQRIQVLMQMEW